MEKNKKVLIISCVVCVLVSLFLGYFLGKINTEGKYEVQLEKIKTFFPAPKPDSPYLYGVLESVEGNSLFLKADNSSNPFDEWPVERNVLVSEKTEIFMRVTKPGDQYARESAAFRANPEKGVMPEPYEDKKIEISDLENGMRLSIEAFENIKLKEEFKAKRITISE